MKILKIKVGEYWDKDKKESVAVYQTAFEKTSKAGKVYYEVRTQVFVDEIQVKEAKPQVTA